MSTIHGSSKQSYWDFKMYEDRIWESEDLKSIILSNYGGISKLTCIKGFIETVFMFCKSLLPSPALQPFVRNYKILDVKFDNNHSIPAKHRPPKPEQGIVFYVKGFVNLHNLNTGTSQIPDPVSIFSHQIDKKRFQIASEFCMFTIFFHSGILHRLIGLPMSELNQGYHDAELFFGTEVKMVTEQLASAPDYLSMIPIVEKFLLGKLNKLKMSDSVDDIAEFLLGDPTGFSLDGIAKEACLSTKQFYRKFVERIGISPKFYSRIARFNHAYYSKINHPDSSWSSIAQTYFYTDYHHLEKEFKEFTGLTPNEWLKENQMSPERVLQLR